MSEFRSALITEVVDGGYILVQELVYHSELLGRDIVVPRGTYTDFASVPWFCRWLVPVSTGRNRYAAVVHDYLCRKPIQEMLKITQKQADAIFLEALKSTGLASYKAYALYLPVRGYQSLKGVFK